MKMLDRCDESGSDRLSSGGGWLAGLTRGLLGDRND